MKQQGHNFESPQNLTSIATANGVRWCNVVLTHVRQIHVNICKTVQLLAGFLQYNGGKVEEVEYSKCVFFVYCVFESK